MINSVRGVVDTIDIEIFSTKGADYSDISFDIEKNMSADGRMLYIPDDHIIEFKYPTSDIRGTIK